MNGANGMSDMERKVTRVGASELGRERVSKPSAPAMLAASLLQGMCAGRVRVSVWVTLEIYFNPANRRRLRVHGERWKMAESRSPQRTIRLYVTRNSSAPFFASK